MENLRLEILNQYNNWIPAGVSISGQVGMRAMQEALKNFKAKRARLIDSKGRVLDWIE